MSAIAGLVLDAILKWALQLVVRAYSLHRERVDSEERAKKAQEIYDQQKTQEGRRRAFQDAFNGTCTDELC